MQTPEQLREESARLRQEACKTNNLLIKQALAALALTAAEQAEKLARESQSPRRAPS